MTFRRKAPRRVSVIQSKSIPMPLPREFQRELPHTAPRLTVAAARSPKSQDTANVQFHFENSRITFEWTPEHQQMRWVSQQNGNGSQHVPLPHPSKRLLPARKRFALKKVVAIQLN